MTGSLLRVLLLALLGGSGASYAQNTTTKPSGDAVEQSPKEMLSSAVAGIERMRGQLQQMNAMLEEAEKRQDTDAIKCLRDKLASTRAMFDVSLLARNAMNEALANSSVARASAEYRKIEVAQTKVDQFLAEAMACLGDDPSAANEVVRSSSGDTSTDLRDFANLGDLTDIGVGGVDGTPFE